MDQLYECMMGLESTKVTVQRNSIENLCQLLNNKHITALLNEGDRFTWNDTLRLVHNFLLKEAERCLKQKSSATDIKKKRCGDYIVDVVHFSCKNQCRINVESLLTCVLDCFESATVRSQFSRAYISVLKDGILEQKKYLTELSVPQWKNIYCLLKELINKPVEIQDQRKYFECFYLLLKYGVLYKFPLLLLRDDLNFFQKLCEDLRNLDINLQVHILKIINEFCRHTANDLRAACCRLGEENFDTIWQLFFRSTCDKSAKVLIIEFFLFQIRMHHPYGHVEGSRSAFAVSWCRWQECLRLMYTIIEKELGIACGRLSKNSVFVTRNPDALQSTFVTFAVEVLKQVFENPNMCNNEEFLISLEYPSQVKKKRKIDISINGTIDSIEETRNWPWINLMTSLLTKYPHLISLDQFQRLLQVLSEIQTECKDANTLYHLYKCLIVLVGVQSCLETLASNLSVETLWSVIWDSTVRAVGLNQNVSEANALIQRLIVLYRFDYSAEIFRPYFSGVLKISEHNLRTLETACHYLKLSDTSNFGNTKESTKTTLMKVILNPENVDVFGYTVTARTLVLLILKQYPEFQLNKIEEAIHNDNLDFEDICLITSFDTNLLYDNRIESEKYEEMENLHLLVDRAYFNDLKELLLHLADNILAEVHEQKNFAKKLVKTITLIYNVNSYLLSYGILNHDTITTNPLHTKLISLLNELTSLFQNVSESSETYIELQRLDGILECFDELFTSSVDTFYACQLRDFCPPTLIKICFDIWYKVDDTPIEDRNSREHIKLRETTLDVLLHYCYVPKVKELTEYQLYALIALTNTDFDANSDVICEQKLKILASLKNYTVGSLSNIMKAVNDVIQKICEKRYNEYEVALNVLKIIHDIFPHMAATKNEDLQKQLSSFIYTFFQCRNDFGPEISVAIVNAINQVVKYDIATTWTSDETEKVSYKLLEFIKSDFIGIRLAAVKNLKLIFNKIDYTIDKYYIQDYIFSALYDTCDETFQVKTTTKEEQLSPERCTDETTTRTASVLHTFGVIIYISNVWRPKALCNLLKVVNQKKIALDSLKRLIEMIANNLGCKDSATFLKDYLNVLIEKWFLWKQSWDTFPYALIGCSSIEEFYALNLLHVVPLMMRSSDREILRNVAESLSRTTEDVIRESFAKITALYLPILLPGCLPDSEMQWRRVLHENLITILGSTQVDRLMQLKLDEVIVHLVTFVYDQKEFFRRMSVENPILYEPITSHINTETFSKILDLLQEKYFENKSVFKILVKDFPSKVQKILLRLTLNIYNSPTNEDRTRAFYQYMLIYDILMDLTDSNKLAKFLVKDFVHTMVNLINKRDDSGIHSAVCNYFKTTCVKILSNCPKLLGEFLSVIINALVPVIQESDAHKECCLDFLKFLIIQNNGSLSEAIQKLDQFPEEENFAEINAVYLAAKCKGSTLTLENEIIFFLNAGKQAANSGLRLSALRHLKVQLAEKKDELKALFAKLYETRGLSEDTGSSIVHKLISMLISLTGSKEENVQIAASNCLGEIGPADLTTLVLQRNTQNTTEKCSPFIFITGQVITFCLEYIFAADSEVLEATSLALYNVMESKEAWLVLDDFDFDRIDRDYLFPFVPSTKVRANSKVVVIGNVLSDEVDDENLWCPNDLFSHSDWIYALVCKLLKTISSEKCYLPYLIPLCKLKLEFCEALLPLLIDLLLRSDKCCSRILSKQIGNFFAKHWEFAVVQERSKETSIIALNNVSVQCMLDVVNFLTREKNDSLQLNKLHVAQAAKFCSAYFSILFYAEQWAYKVLEDMRKSSQKPNPALDLTLLDLVCQYLDKSERIGLQNLLKVAYTAIGDLDALHGCGSSQLLEESSRLDYYKQLGRWQQVILHQDVQISNGINSAVPNLMASLKHCSLYELPLLCASTGAGPDFECMWRLGQWNFSKNERNDKSTHDVQEMKYFAMKAVHENDWYNFEDFVRVSHLAVIERLNFGNLESCMNLYGPLCHLQSLVELKDFAEAKKSKTFACFLEKWGKQDEINRNEFKYVEPIRAQRIVMFRDLVVHSKWDELKDSYIDLYLNFTELARNEGQLSVATRALEDMHHIEHLTDITKIKLKLEEAQICWANNDRHTGRHILRQLLSFQRNPESLRASILKLYGTWMMETNSQSTQTILHDYLFESLKLDSIDRKQNSKCETYVTIARFADKEYQRVMTYIKSCEFEKKVQTMMKSKDKAEQLRRSKKKSTDQGKAMALYDRQSKIDEQKINITYKEKDLYLTFATKYYLKILLEGDKHDTCIFRLLSLWLENRSNTEMSNVLKQKLPLIATHKFITILPQLVPHITTTEDDDLSNQITQILERCVNDHPHHTLPLILALDNSELDKVYNTSSAQTEVNELRVEAARKLLEKVSNGSMRVLIEKMRNVADAIVQLAYAKVEEPKSTKKVPQTIPAGLKIRRLKNLGDVLLPTYTLPVKKDGNYTDIVGIYSFGDKFLNVGGINMPKRISCRGTDGVVRLQLVKGQDDLRQDGVMQQVFTIMNGFFASKKQTSKLLIRTYKVVPLSMRSGILEWVETTTLGDYLAEAHAKYNTQKSYTLQTSRAKLHMVAKRSLEEKLKTYKEICDHVQPVFHKYFETTFLEPAVWYERKRLYMYSVATSSMCGYILGIGDRHVQNILVDNVTAEVIHIDFGIAFDQGHVLPTPETVPFRLTRDIEDGMGICGIEGVFRRACERTMEVLRQNQETIIAILEVLLYDPLYTWTVSPAEAFSRQQDAQDESVSDLIRLSDEESTSLNVSAERALLRLKEKLEGREDGSTMSIEGQVEKLLQQARNPTNLCQLYSGWQAYL